jgi:hypothetical protein
MDLFAIEYKELNALLNKDNIDLFRFKTMLGTSRITVELVSLSDKISRNTVLKISIKWVYAVNRVRMLKITTDLKIQLFRVC